MNAKVRIIVLGDIAQQVVLVPDEKDQFIKHKRWIGAPLLEKMILKAVEPDGEIDCLHYDDIMDSMDPIVCQKCDEFIAVLGPYPKTSGVEKQDKVMRLSQDLRTHWSRNDKQEEIEKSDDISAAFEKIRDNCEAKAEQSAPTILVIYDRGLVFREYTHLFRATVDRLTESDHVIYAIQDELTLIEQSSRTVTNHEEKLNEKLEDSLNFFATMKNQVILVVTAEALRRAGHAIGEFGSIEQAVEDIVSHIDRDPLRSLREKCGKLVVIFNETAVLYLDQATPENERSETDLIIESSIHLCPNHDYIAQIDPKRYGSMPSRVSILVTALVRSIHAAVADGSSPDLQAGLRLGVVGFNRFSEQGFKPADKKESERTGKEVSPFDIIEEALSKSAIDELKKEHEKRNRLIASLNFRISKNQCIKKREAEAVLPERRRKNRRTNRHEAPEEPWDRVAVFTRDHDRNWLRNIIYRIVKEGVDKAFQNPPKEETSGDASKKTPKPWFPAPIIACPYAEFGKYKTVDEREVASYLDLSKLIYKYLNNESWDKPLSIAVFGPPGSGKSFAVKEILKSASPRSVEKRPLEFNLAQFSSVDQLTAAFHLVQDSALSDDDVPLVIFDEFDSVFHGGASGGDGYLGWLKYFLAPMQDGLFRGGSQDYRVGRAIFLFSGGLASSFEGFQCLVRSKKEQSKIKLPDFISRLRGHLTVSGINYATDRTPIIRIKRAMLLRSLLEIHAKPILGPRYDGKDSVANIRSSVIDRFVDEWNYMHGIRSMEAVIQASRWVSDLYADSSLPSSAQLQTHVYTWRSHEA